MEVESDNDQLIQIANGSPVEEGTWLSLRADILSRLDSIVHKEFAIPDLPTPPPAPDTRLLSSLEPEASSQEANKENAPIDESSKEEKETEESAAADDAKTSVENGKKKPLAPGELPPQIASMLADIKTHLEGFATHAPHTIQRLAELVLSPRGHYRALATYLHAVDRVVRVTSGTNTYPLPPPVPNMTAINGDSAAERDPASDVAWSNPTTAVLGSDEALGGALLTPIPWLTARESPAAAPASEENTGEEHDANGAAAEPVGEPGAQIHSEATETIDGPNGVGRVETVSVSVNGVPSTGHHARGVTQGELLRQEQRAGVVPVNQTGGHLPAASTADDNEGAADEEQPPATSAAVDGEEPVEDEDTPHARGPEEIGVGDTGPQGTTTSFVAEDGVLTHGIDVEAAVGRRQDPPQEAEDDASAESDGGTKREADMQLEPETVKKVKEDEPDKEQDSAMDDGS